ncbi:hypothetical protein QC823_02865 [Halomonas vilamensis]|uniref:Uncharacterized protein n=1 Tax=Vreelandella vilamensis TaxID=531309 RepID=A0ABU1H0V3_9GAMM|nr:hypothetical protein [Halomonas vilamensis]MDR5897931.1 hypothetical protein [Halomonas vilamensis]
MQKRMWRVGCVLLLALLTACGGSEPEQQTSESSPDPAESSAESISNKADNEQEQALQEEIQQEPLTVTMETTIGLRTDRRVTVSGETNLPDATQISVLVERELSGVRWRERTQVENGRFSVGPLGPGSGLPDGDYRVSVESLEASVQPMQVRQRIGQQGEHLAGEWVNQSRHGLGQIVEYSRRVLIGSESRRTRDEVDVLAYPRDAS